MTRILLLDNYDSFTYNLFHYVEKVSNQVVIDVVRNDMITLEEVKKYDKLLLSPGPGLPEDAGILKDVIQEYASTKSILGICLGQQAIGEVFGCKLKNLSQVSHGEASEIRVMQPHFLFTDLPAIFKVGRYHSWVLDEECVNETGICINAITTDASLIMAISHRRYDVCGVQFHPESILSEHGEKLISNWVNR